MSKARILLLDDDPDLVTLLSTRLSDDGYDVTSASDGIACMARLRREDPDLVVLDLGISAGDGYLTLERLRGNPHWASLPVVVLTANNQAETLTRALRSGATAFVEKTSGSEEFLDTISRLVERDSFAL